MEFMKIFEVYELWKYESQFQLFFKDINDVNLYKDEKKKESGRISNS